MDALLAQCGVTHDLGAMFEAQVAFYLNKYLGRYVAGLDAESLKISVWKGDVELRNLLLKPEALAGLNLPITVKSGLLGRLTLKASSSAPCSAGNCACQSCSRSSACHARHLRSCYSPHPLINTLECQPIG